MKIITYEEIMKKYPEATEDLKKLQDSKNSALMGYRILWFLVGVSASILYVNIFPLC